MTALSTLIPELQQLWDLDQTCVYLNHGSFGPSPRPVLVAREQWSRRLESQPMRFFCQEMEQRLEDTAAVLAQFLRTRADRLVLVDNATFAMNIVASSVALQSGDEVMLTDHEYGAVRNLWSARCQQSGARLVTVSLPFPPDVSGVVEAIRSRISPHTRLIVISHVTSPTACILPVQQICTMAREAGVPVCIDGPHALAMLDVFPDEIGCDYYCASGHKWLCAPFGSGFLWVHPKNHAQVRCPVISWGGSIAGRAASWKDRINWMGTRDPSPLLAMADAVRFFSGDTLQSFREHAHGLICRARRALLEIPGVGSFCTPNESDFVSMCAVELPQPPGWKPGYHGHPDPLQLELRDQYGIEVPVGSWNGHRFLRLSAHLYNTLQDIDQLLQALCQAKHLHAG